MEGPAHRIWQGPVVWACREDEGTMGRPGHDGTQSAPPVASDQLTPNFSTLIAAKSLTAPPTRLVA